MSNHMPKSTAETIARIKVCAFRGTSWNNVALVDDLCLVMTEVLDRLSAIEQREARLEKPAEKLSPIEVMEALKDKLCSAGEFEKAAELLDSIIKLKASQPSQPQPVAGVETDADTFCIQLTANCSRYNVELIRARDAQIAAAARADERERIIEELKRGGEYAENGPTIRRIRAIPPNTGDAGKE